MENEPDLILWSLLFFLTTNWGWIHIPGASWVAQVVKNLPSMQKTSVRFLGWKFPWRRNRLSIPVFLEFPGGSDSKQSACNVGDLGLIPGLGRCPRGGHDNPLQHSYLESPMDIGARQATVHSVAKSWTWLKWLRMHVHIPDQRYLIVCVSYPLDYKWSWQERPSGSGRH